MKYYFYKTLRKILFYIIFLISFLIFLVQTKADFNISSADLVSEKFGRIQKDYTILNNPLGKGIFKINNYYINFFLSKVLLVKLEKEFIKKQM